MQTWVGRGAALAVLLLGTIVLSQPADQKTAAPKRKRKPPMASQETPERSAIPDKYKWNTRDLFASDEAWEKERKSLVTSFKEITRYRGKLGQGKATVKACLDQVFKARKRLARLSSYASRRFDEDTRVAKYQGFREVTEKVGADFLAATSFLQPELLALPERTLREMTKDRSFADYSHELRDILRQKPHILSPAEEALLAATSLMRDTGYTVYSAFSGADLKFPEIRDEKGKKVRLTQALFVRYRASADRRVREDAFKAFFGTFQSYGSTIAALLSAQINANIVYARARRYRSALEAALDVSNIPTSVYHNMIKAMNEHLPLLHRYLKLRQKLLGVPRLEYHDMYPPIIKKVDLKFPYEEAGRLLVKAMAPLGKDYVAVLGRGLQPGSGWVDVFPNQGKKSGAYMDGGAYDVHPYILGNYLEGYNSLSMLAHEMGHALHSYSSNKHQPYAKSDYSIFVAEVASTLNEALLMQHMLDEVKDPRQRLFLLGEELEGFRQTCFRQAMFAEFELSLYQRAERQEALTAETISKIYLEIVRRYYGHDQGVVHVAEQSGAEWAYIPHFYYNYYVFQYVTGLVASTALAEMIARDGARASERYIKHLIRAGSSDYPITLLKHAGVDLTTTRPYEIAMASFKKSLLEAEALVKKIR